MGNSLIVSRINGLLAEKGMPKQKFYKDCGITSASYSLWNTGKTTPRMKNLEVIADYLRTTTDYLLTGLGEKEKAPTPAGERSVSDDDIKFALFGGDGEITDAMYDEVKRFAKMVKLREEADKKKD